MDPKIAKAYKSRTKTLPHLSQKKKAIDAVPSPSQKTSARCLVLFLKTFSSRCPEKDGVVKFRMQEVKYWRADFPSLLVDRPEHHPIRALINLIQALVPLMEQKHKNN